MAQDIIQHHEPFDFESFFEGIKSQYIGIDYHDFSNFLHTAGKKHSFMGSAGGKDRVKVWGLAEDASLGNKIKTIILINTKF